MSWADLHTHSRWSDGEWTPGKLVRAARRAGLGGLAITDHDDVRAQAEAVEAGHEHGVAVLTGVEISAWRAGMDIHILGYGFDAEDPTLLRLCDAARHAREDRAVRMVGRLGELGAPVSMEEVRRIAGDAGIGRPHVARALLEAGWVPTMRDAFDRYLGDGKPACVDKLRVTPAEAIATLHGAGGVAVCAHPITVGREEILDAMVADGMDGVEVRHGLHGTSLEGLYDAYARSRGLVRTGGSDFHGPRLGSQDPGSTRIPKDWWDALVDRIDDRRVQAGKPPREKGAS